MCTHLLPDTPEAVGGHSLGNGQKSWLSDRPEPLNDSPGPLGERVREGERGEEEGEGGKGAF